MEIKRNIFDSSAKMPASYEPVAVKMPTPGVNDPTLPGHEKTDHSVVHARSPRVGDK
jgi:hypothetical protein